MILERFAWIIEWVQRLSHLELRLGAREVWWGDRQLNGGLCGKLESLFFTIFNSALDSASISF